MDYNYLDIKSKAIKSIKWSFFLELLNKFSGPITTLILTKIILPDDFGVFAIAFSLIAIIGSFQDLGLTKTLIQQQKRFNHAINSSFWLNFIFSIFIFFIMFFVAPYVADFYNDNRITLLIRLLSTEFLFPTLIPMVILIRNFSFKETLFINLVMNVTSTIITIVFALKGYGYLALLIGNVAGTLINFALLWRITQWRPKFYFELKLIKKLLSFGKWIMIEGFCILILSYGEIMIVAHFLGTYDTAIYQIGGVAAGFIFNLTINPILTIVYPFLSRIQNNRKYLYKITNQSIEILSIVSLPIGLFLFLFGTQISSLIWQDQWQGIGLIISLLGIKLAIGNILAVLPEAFKAIGHPEVNVKSAFFDLMLFIPVYIFITPLGLKYFTLGTIFAMIMGIIIFTYFTKKYFQVGFLKISKLITPAFWITFLITPILIFLKISISGSSGFLGWSELILVILFTIFIYTFIFKILYPEKYNNIFSLFIKSLHINDLLIIKENGILKFLKWRIAQKNEKTFWNNFLSKDKSDLKWLRFVLNQFDLNINYDFKKDILLDIGAGPIGILSIINAKRKIALDPLNIKSINESIERSYSHGEEIPFESNFFDKIFIYNCLQHVINPEDVLNEAYRVCKKNGKIFILEQLNIPTDSLHPNKLERDLFDLWTKRNKLKIIKFRIIKNRDFGSLSENSSGSIITIVIQK